MTYEIEKNVEMPVNARSSKYPCDAMEIGDSFALDDKTLAQARQIAVVCGKRTGLKFAARQTESGVRIWRIE